MKYISTRGKAPTLSFGDTVLTGLAEDGGLYLPESYPQLDYALLKTCTYQEMAFHILKPYVASEIEDKTLQAIIERSYTNFHHPAIAPLKQLSGNHWLLELFHGPTLAFKDYALQFLGQLFDHLLTERKTTMTVLGATSGDTGSAAIHGCMASDAIQIFILHPHNRVSDVQRRQMTTIDRDNVHNIAIQGNFDDCQNIVKAAFGDLDFRQQMKLSAINSINWARILAQVVYYAHVCVSLNATHDNPINFSVPSGNFGNIFAAWVGKKMGLPIADLIAGSNRNDILARSINHGDIRKHDVEPSLSPSMDIQISSNFERLLFELTGRNSDKLVAQMHDIKTGQGRLPTDITQKLQREFSAYKLDDNGILSTIGHTLKTTGELIDPHTAVGVAAGNNHKSDHRTVSLACAHPAKFPDAVKTATGITPKLPNHLDDIFALEEFYEVMGNDVDGVKRFIVERSK